MATELYLQLKVAATRGFTIPGCDNLRSDSRQAYRRDMPLGACHPPLGTPPDVYARSVNKPTFRYYFARINKTVVLSDDGLKLRRRG